MSKKYIVMLDPGHGGKDPGAIGGGEHEADKVLTLCLYEKELWEEIGVTAILTRKDDSYASLQARTDMENRVKPDCFISHHMDAGDETACGCTAWLHHLAPASYQQWAKDITDGISKFCTSNRSKTVNLGYVSNPAADYHINRETAGPSVLLELGFITNNINREEMEKYYKDYAKAIVSGTCKFLGIAEDIEENQQIKKQLEEEKEKREKAEKKLEEIRIILNQ